MSARPPRVITLVDSEPYQAVARCSSATQFAYIVGQWYADWAYASDEYEPDMVAVDLRWFRWNPCAPNVCGEHRAHLEEVDGAGPGRWMGSYVLLRLKDPAPSPVTDAGRLVLDAGTTKGGGS